MSLDKNLVNELMKKYGGKQSIERLGFKMPKSSIEKEQEILEYRITKEKMKQNRLKMLTCNKCGNYKSTISAKQCNKCLKAERLKLRIIKTTCSGCGGKKDSKAKFCRSCSIKKRMLGTKGIVKIHSCKLPPKQPIKYYCDCGAQISRNAKHCKPCAIKLRSKKPKILSPRTGDWNGKKFVLKNEAILAGKPFNYFRTIGSRQKTYLKKLHNTPHKAVEIYENEKHILINDFLEYVEELKNAGNFGDFNKYVIELGIYKNKTWLADLKCNVNNIMKNNKNLTPCLRVVLKEIKLSFDNYMLNSM